MKIIKNNNENNNVKLKNLCSITLGQSPNSESYSELETDIPFFQGAADFSLKYTNIRNYTKDAKKTAKKGDLLMTVRAPVGRVNFANVDCAIGRGICALNCQDESLKMYLYFYLMNLYNKNGWNKDVQGAIFEAVNKDAIENKEIIINFSNYKNITKWLVFFEKRLFLLQSLLEKIEIRNQYYADKLLNGELSIDKNGKVSNIKNEVSNFILSELFDFRMGQTILKKDVSENKSDMQIPVYSATENDIPFGFINVSKVNKLLNENDIIISARGTIGFPKINNIKQKTSTQTTIQMISKGIISSYIVKKYLDIKKDYFFSSEGAAVPQLTINTLSDKKIKIIKNYEDCETFLKNLDLEKEKVEKLLKLEEKRFEWLSDKLLSGEYIIED